MPKAKKKLLPKDFDVQLKVGDVLVLKAIFETCDLDARGGYTKQTALAFPDCPKDLMHWLVGQGADIEAKDSYGRTPLHSHSGSLKGQVETLLSLGADIQASDIYGDTPLHKACKSFNFEAVRVLCRHGAHPDALNSEKLTPLTAGLKICSNIQIKPMAAIAELFLKDNKPEKKNIAIRIMQGFTGRRDDTNAVTDQMRELVQAIGKNFEFHRAGFNPDSVEEVGAALGRLYDIFGVEPVPRRLMHQGQTPIVLQSADWQDQHQELWELLVPSNGAASTVQGEVIRISGRVADEIDRNGGVNWDPDYNKMMRALVAHLKSGQALTNSDFERASTVASAIRHREGAGAELCELAVRWVKLNPTPIALAPPAYAR